MRKNTKQQPKTTKVKYPESFNDNGYLTVKVRLEKNLYKKIRFGKSGNPESEKLYRLFIADYIGNSSEAVQKWTADSKKSKASLLLPTDESPENSLSLGELIDHFLDDKKNDVDYNHYKRVGKLLTNLFTKYVPASRITRQELLQFRDTFNSTPSERTGEKPSRQYTNKMLSVAKKIFLWGCKRGLLPTSVKPELECAEPVAYDKGNRETEPRQDVSDNVINATLPHLLPTIRAMVQVLRLSGARPSEICRMRVGDIDMKMREKDGVWIFRLGKHKTARLGKNRMIVLNRISQEIIKPFLAGKKPEDYVFSPKQTLAESRERRAAKRKSPKTTPKGNSRIADHYNATAFNRAIKRSIESANRKLSADKQIPHWTAYQLRHAYITNTFLETENLDTARAGAGQKNIATTMNYNHADLNTSINHATRIQKNPFAETTEKIAEPKTVVPEIKPILATAAKSEPKPK
jgi:integrase